MYQQREQDNCEKFQSIHNLEGIGRVDVAAIDYWQTWLPPWDHASISAESGKCLCYTEYLLK